MAGPLYNLGIGLILLVEGIYMYWVLIAADGEVLTKPAELSEETAVRDNRWREDRGRSSRWEKYDPRNHDVSNVRDFFEE